METIKTDALIIGSGFGGMAPALRLASAGFKTIVLEKGPDLNPFRDLKQTQDPKYLTRYLKNTTGRGLNLNYIEALGGGSAFYEMVSLRAPSIAFNVKDEEGNRIWPEGIDRAILDPYYQLAEKELNVTQIEPKNIPKSGQAFSLLMKNLGYSVERAPFAVKNCINSGYCVTGCIYGAKQSLHFNYIPKAKQAGALIYTETSAKSIIPLKSYNTDAKNLTYKYKIITNSPDGKIQFTTKLLILAGGTVGTAKLLIDSRQNLPLLSDHIGKNISFNGGIKLAGLLPDWCPDGDLFTGRSIPGIVSFEFLKSHGVTLLSAKPMPLQLMATARVYDPASKSNGFWGRDHVDLMKKARHRMIVLVALGLAPSMAEITRKANGNFKLDLKITAPLRDYYRRTRNLLESILIDNGGKVLGVDFVDRNGMPHKNLHFTSAHQVGSCRMSDSPHRGVVDKNGEVFGYPGMFVTDGASIPYSLAVNSALTILANAERVSEHIVNSFTGLDGRFLMDQFIVGSK